MGKDPKTQATQTNLHIRDYIKKKLRHSKWNNQQNGKKSEKTENGFVSRLYEEIKRSKQQKKLRNGPRTRVDISFLKEEK